MTLSGQLFWTLLETGREDDAWDFKQEIDFDNRGEFADFLKDLIAFANHGGGHLLLGVRKDDHAAVGVTRKYDPAEIGQKAEKALGVHIPFTLSYFTAATSGGVASTLGILEIEPSRRLVASAREVGGKDGKTVIREGDVFTRRSTRTIRATADDIEQILERFAVSLERTAPHFAGLFDNSRTFHHSRPLIGRDAFVKLIVSSIDSGTTVVLLGGRGGSGKSRILLQAARELEQLGVPVRWVRDDVVARADVAGEIPTGPAFVFCDDAHRRTDLSLLLSIPKRRNVPTTLVLGIRPVGRDAIQVAALRAGIELEQINDLGNLPDLRTDELETIVKAELGREFEQWAHAVVERAPDSPLVSLVAARLLAARLINPAVVVDDPEFRYHVLTAFQQEILGELGPGVDATLARKSLEVLAAVGPLEINDQPLIDNLATFLGTDSATLRSTLGALEHGGIVRSVGSRIRITPDVLADVILESAIIDRTGRPTGYERRILEELHVSVVPPLVRNVAELDWRFSELGKPLDIFGTLWERVQQVVRFASNRERVDVLKALSPVAVFQPTRILALCEWLANNPENETADHQWFRATKEDVLNALPSLIAGVSLHRSSYRAAIDLLWRLGRVDSRETNPYPDHAMRVLKDVVSYYPRRAFWRQELAVDALERWTNDPGWSSHHHTPLVVAEQLLETAAIEETWRGNALTMTRYSVIAAATHSVRVRAIEILRRLALGAEPKGRIVAASMLLKALDSPDQSFGHAPTRDEEAGWEPQYILALGAIRSVVETSSDPLVKIKLSDGLAWVALRIRLPAVRVLAKQIKRSVRSTSVIREARVIGQNFRDGPDPRDWERASLRGDALTKRIVGSSRVDLQACKLEYSIVSPK